MGIAQLDRLGDVAPMMTRACFLVACLLVIASPAAATPWFGFMFDAITGRQSRASTVRPGGRPGFQIRADAVRATLVCRQPASGACNGRRGRIDGRLSASIPEQLTGDLVYQGGRLVCALECEVSELPGQGPRSFWSCIYRCPSGARVTLGTFHIQRRV
jgi:hypothetical protein